MRPKNPWSESTAKIVRIKTVEGGQNADKETNWIK